MEEGTEDTGRYLPLSDYGMLGDCRSAALVSRGGSIDWCCWPNFDSASVFGRLLDHEKGGYFAIRPVGPFRCRRRYVGPTNVLETTFETPDGMARLTDLMPALTEDQKRRRMMPFRGILRRIEGVEGRVLLEAIYSPRPYYGQPVPRLESRSPNDVFGQSGKILLHLRSDLPLAAEGPDVRRRFAVERGTRHYFALGFSEDAPAVYPSIGDEAEREIQMSLDFWSGWSSTLRYSGPYLDEVLRSALVLKLLTYAPSGAIVAAPTTSLPEHVGGVRNWDYRYCWLRDASFTVRALYELGFHTEGHAFMDWVLHATRLTHPALQVLYNVYGESYIPEREMSHLDGYRGSRPVRVGNNAFSQFQIDLYGEFMDALERYYNEVGTLDSDTRGLLTGAADLIARRWSEPDNGVWEMRSGRMQYVHGKVMAWAALDRAAAIARRAGIRGAVEHWERAREEIRAAVLARGFNPQLNSFVRTFGGRHVDGSLLTLPLVRFIPADDPRMVSTIEAVRRLLGEGDLIYRYRGVDDGLPGQQGAFLTCSFWLVGSLALAGRLEEAHSTFCRLLSRGNDLGLFPEEVDPASGEYLGNFPQALTHIALINAALTLQQAERQRESQPAVEAAQNTTVDHVG